MFKRVEKRIKKTVKEEELGLDAEMKEALGLNTVDTDSDESNSDSDSEKEVEDQSSSDSEDSGDEVSGQEGGAKSLKRKRAEEDEDGGEDNDSGVEDGGEDDGEESGDENPNIVPFSMTIAEALSNPTYIQSLDPEIQACIVCPGKLLKNKRMINVHLTSGGHKRRFNRFVAAATKLDVDHDADPRTIVSTTPLPPPVSAKSKRAEKRIERLANIREKRRRQQEAKRRKKERKEKERKGKASVEGGGGESTPKPAADTTSCGDFISLSDSPSKSKTKNKDTSKSGARQKGQKEREGKEGKLAPSVKKREQDKIRGGRGVTGSKERDGEADGPAQKKMKLDQVEGKGGGKRQTGKRKGKVA